MTRRRKAVVIGGGIGGLAAAIALRRTGWDVLVFERSVNLREIGTGMTIWCNGVKALNRLGVDILTKSATFDWFTVHSRRGELLGGSGDQPYSVRYGAPSLGVHRGEVLRQLATHVPGEFVRTDMQCVGFTPGGNRPVARFANGHCEEADLIVGADGLHSAIRAQLLGDRPLRPSGYVGFRGIVQLAGLGTRANHATETWGRGLRFGLIPCGADRYFWWATCNRSLTESGAGTDQDVVRRLYDGWHHPIPQIIAATPASDIIRTPIVDRPPVARWGRDAVTLLGDAAHPMTPNFGQGACMALEDAVVLAECLAGTRSVPEGVSAYESQRAPRTAMVVWRSWAYGRVAQWESSPLVWIRDRVAKIPLVHRATLAWLDSMLSFETPALPELGPS